MNLDNDAPRVQRGSEAALDPIRTAIQNDTSRDEALTNEEEEILFETQASFEASWVGGSAASGSDGDTSIQGKIVVTTDRLLFLATDSGNVNHDASVDARCIHMHALASDPVSVYIQLAESHGDDVDPIELTLVPLDNATETCQSLFERLSELITRHPILGDDDDDDDGEDADNMMFFAPPAMNGVSPPAQDRRTMLDRLDNMLVVPPELEVQEGQFDDAEDGVSDDEML